MATSRLPRNVPQVDVPEGEDIIITFCRALPELLSVSENIWPIYKTEIPAECISLLSLMHGGSPAPVVYPDFFLLLSKLLLHLTFRGAYITKGLTSTEWTLATSLRSYLESPRRGHELHFIALTRILKVLCSQDDIYSDQPAWIAAAHAFIILSELPDLSRLAWGPSGDILLSALDWALALPAPDHHIPPEATEAPSSPFIRLQLGTLQLLQALISPGNGKSQEFNPQRLFRTIPNFVDKVGTIVLTFMEEGMKHSTFDRLVPCADVLEGLPYFADRVGPMMSAFVEDGMRKSKPGRLEACANILQGLLGSDWMNHPSNVLYMRKWIHILVQSARSSPDRPTLQWAFPLSSSHVNKLLMCERLLDPYIEPVQTFWHSDDVQCVAFMSLTKAWTERYAVGDTRAWRALSIRMTQYLPQLRDESVQCLEDYINVVLKRVNTYTRLLGTMYPPHFLEDFRHALAKALQRVRHDEEEPEISPALVTYQDLDLVFNHDSSPFTLFAE